MVITLPPLFKNCFNAGIDFCAVILPSCDLNSAGISASFGSFSSHGDASGRIAGIAPSTKTITSYFSFKLPASMAEAYVKLKGK